MLRVNGFYGHVRHNDLRSLVMFAGFLIAFQALAAVVMFLPLIFLDTQHAPFFPCAYAERYVPIVFAAGVVLFVMRLSRHVASVRSEVAFVDVERRADPRLVNIVETLAIAAGLPMPRVGMIESPARNAFACGLTTSSAIVVVTRGLVEALDDDELAAVIAHEIAHIANGDIRLMAAANVLMENLLLLQRKNVLRLAGWKQVVVAVLMPPILILFLASGFVTRIAMTLARASRLLISSSREFIADAEAVRLTHNPGALISALRKVEGRSEVPGVAAHADAMMIDGAVEGPYASHPTIAERIAVLARLAGSATIDNAARKDTRSPAHVGAGAGVPFGRRPLPHPALPATAARGILQRVNAGTDENMFGVTPKVKRMLKIGFAVLIGFQLWAAFSARSVMSHVESEFSNVSSTLAEPGAGRPKGTNQGSSGESRLRREIKRLSSLGAGEARCFATEDYRVGDRGLHTLPQVDRGRVEAFAGGLDPGSSDIIAERYLGLRVRSVRAVLDARPTDLDRALLSYVETRKSMLQVMHRFFAQAGLDLMRQAYDGREDAAILGTLRERLAEDAPALRAKRSLAREMEFLVASPKEFMPCLVRAEASAPR